ncbi:MAG: Rne/Rng family ribonuclease [Hyphomicrobiaceae bacterium]
MTINKMLIDAAHPEETRVAVLRGDRIEEFDYESANKKLLRGNIYLAKVTRVEPSLQAAFVEYGGNRHGFLAFSDIHPDYYQIPFADRQALLAAEAEAAAEEDEDEDDELPPQRPDADDSAGEHEAGAEGSAAEAAAIDGASVAVSGDPESAGAEAHGEDGPPQVGLVEEQGVVEIDTSEANGVEEVGAEDALEEVQRTRRRRPVRTYKIQEVIKRRQILLVQVVKEERGNKGAALTTYLSLAGRYTVLMPNTGRGGGISRKITNAADRKRLKEITTELQVPDGMGLIVRTAGAARGKAEVKRDFEYLMRLWETIRDLTLRSTAPALVYEEGNLIRRAIRDLYTKEIEDIVVAGDAAFEDARDFMRMLMPTHVKAVQHYTEPEPVFTRYQIERQLNQFYSPQVTLPSGGYIVINQTEALVAIDVNSGKSTREHSIEETALRTNLEASDEIARQLRLRDLAGLVVIDFIDMDERRNNRSVERRIKEALKNDRARIQVGRISHFGLLEMSRQRLRTGVLEGSTSPCAHCAGTGVIRSTESVALGVLRSIEDALQTGHKNNLVISVSVAAALYILNAKRSYLRDIESRHGIIIEIKASDRLHGANFTIERHAAAPQPKRVQAAVPAPIAQTDVDYPEDEEIEAEERAEADAPAPSAEQEEDGERRRGRRRRRRRGRGRGDRPEGEPMSAGGDAEPSQDDGAESDDSGADDESGAPDGEERPDNGARADAQDGDGDGRRRRRRGRRGGRRNRERGRDRETPVNAGGDQQPEGEWTNARERQGEDRDGGVAAAPDASPPTNGAHHAGYENGRSGDRPDAGAEAAGPLELPALPVAAAEPAPQPVAWQSTPEPSFAVSSVETETVIEEVSVTEEKAPEAEATPPAPSGPPRRGWWQRKTV